MWEVGAQVAAVKIQIRTSLVSTPTDAVSDSDSPNNTPVSTIVAWAYIRVDAGGWSIDRLREEGLVSRRCSHSCLARMIATAFPCSQVAG